MILPLSIKIETALGLWGNFAPNIRVESRYFLYCGFLDVFLCVVTQFLRLWRYLSLLLYQDELLGVNNHLESA